MGQQSSKVNPQEAQAMLRLYLSGTSVSAIARQFNRNRKTVQRIKREDRWDQAERKVQTAERDATIQEIVQERLSNLKLLRSLKDPVIDALLRDLRSQEYCPSLGDAIKLLKYEDELLGMLPEEGASASADIITNYVVNIDNADDLARVLGNAQAGLTLRGAIPGREGLTAL